MVERIDQDREPIDADEARLVILRLLNDDPTLSQRQLAELIGISLGKTHYVLRALLNAGLVRVRRFRKSDQKLAYAYVLTPSGLRERVQLTYAFLARKERQFESLKKTIEMLKSEIDLVARPHDADDDARAKPEAMK